MNPVIKGILDDLMSKKISQRSAAFHIDQLAMPQEKIDRNIEEYFAELAKEGGDESKDRETA